MSSRTRPPAYETEYDERDYYDDEPVNRPRGSRRPPQRPVRTFGLPVLGVALAGGLVIGYLANSGGGSTVTETVTATRTVTAPTAAAGTADGAATRAAVSLAILNGSGQDGLAGSTAEQARAMGYADVTEGNAPEPATADRVLYRQGAEGQARLVAQDLGLPAPLPVAQDSAASAAAAADVIVVLGSDDASTGATGAASDATGAASDATGADAAASGATDDGTAVSTTQ